MDLVILFWVGTGLLPPIVSVVGGAGMSCLPGYLLCHSLPVKSLTQLRVNKDQVTTPLSLDTNSPMAMSKANSSNGVDFKVNLRRIWLNTRFTFAVVIKHPTRRNVVKKGASSRSQSQSRFITVGNSKQELQILLSAYIRSQEQRAMDAHILACLLMLRLKYPPPRVRCCP